MMKTMIETARLCIYPASTDEMRAYIENTADADLKKAYGEMLAGCKNHPEQYLWYAMWMIETKDGAHTGDLCFKGLGDDGSVEIGYGIDEEYRGRGYATEAAGAMVKWALSQPGISRVEAEAEEANAPSRRVLEKCGFVPTGKVGEEGPRFEVRGKSE